MHSPTPVPPNELVIARAGGRARAEAADLGESRRGGRGGVGSRPRFAAVGGRETGLLQGHSPSNSPPCSRLRVSQVVCFHFTDGKTEACRD